MNRKESPRYGFRLHKAVVCLVVVGICSFTPSPLYPFTPSFACAQETIQRIVLPPERVAGEMERVKRNVLSRLSRDEFEALVQAAAGATESARNPPKLVRTRYTAALSGDGLVGTADWKVVHTANGPGRLPLNSLQLALRKATWPENRPAILGSLDDQSGSLELLVEKPGEQTLSLEWSARGVPEPAGLRFDLRIPPCPMASLEIDLPDDQTPQADRDAAIMTGPFPARSAGRRLWRFALTGSSETLQLLLQHPPRPGRPGPVIRQAIHTTQRLSPGQVEGEWEFDLTVLRGSVRDLTFECDAGLRPYDLLVAGLERWDAKALRDGRTQVQAHLREPFQGGRATVKALALLAAPAAQWDCPGVRVEGGALLSETLALRIHPDLKLEDWKPGAFRWIAGQTAADRVHILTLRSALGSIERPHVRVRSSGPVFDVDQTMEWQIEPTGGQLTAVLTYRGRTGATFPLSLALPESWDVEQIDAVPTDPALRWTVANGSRILTVEPGRPVSGEGDNSSPYRLTVQLKSPQPRWDTGADGPSANLTLPDIVPIGVRERKGELTVRLGAALSAVPSPPDSFPLHSLPLEGAVRVRPKSARLQADCEGDAILTAGRIQAAFRLQLTPTGSLGRELFLFSSAPPSGAWSWKTLEGANDIRTVTPLPVLDAVPYLASLGAATPWDLPLMLQSAHIRSGSWWRVTFGRPLQEPVLLEFVGEFPSRDSRVSIPLLAVPAAERMDGSMTVTYSAQRARTVAIVGVREQRATAEPPSPGLTRRRFRYVRQPLSLELLDRPATASAPIGANAIAQPMFDGRVVVHFTFPFSGLQAQPIPVRLPNGASLISVRIDGRDVPNPLEESPDGRKRVMLPATDAEWAMAELVYECSNPSWRLATRASAAAPEFPFPLAVHWIWQIPERMTALPASSWHRANGEWIPPIDGNGDRLLLVETTAINGIGILLAVLVGLIVAAISIRRSRAAIPLISAWAATGLLLLVWLPPHLRMPLLAPLIGSLLGAMAIGSFFLVRRRVSTVASLGLVIALWPILVGIAAAPGPVPVYLIPDSAGEATSVLAPPDLLDRLRETVHRATPSAPAILLGSRYEGRVHGEVVQFDAQFAVHCFSDGPATITIPLSGVMIRGAAVDGKPAFPRPGIGPDRFAFNLSGKGAHSLALQFDVGVSGLSDQEIRFTIPPAAIGRLVFHLAPGLGQPQMLSWRGSQHVTESSDGPILEADLGRVGAIQIRWRPSGTSNSPLSTPVQKVVVWDVNESSTRVQAVFRHRLGTQYVSRLEYDLPPEWEPINATVRPVDDRAAAVGLIGIKEWLRSERPDSSRLGLEFQTPLTGHIQVSVEMIPKLPLTRTPSLPLPHPAGGGDRESLLVVRLRGWDADVADAHGLEPAALEGFPDLWQMLRADTGSRRPTFIFRPTTAANPALRLALRPPSPAGRGESDLTWRVGPGRADVRATAKWLDPPVSGLLEWNVSAEIAIQELRGPNVRSWSRTGSRVQIWLDRAANAANKEVAIELIGRRLMPKDEAALEKSPFVLSPVSLAGVAAQTTTVRLQTDAGWRIFPINAAAFRPAVTVEPPGFHWTGITTDPAPRAEFRLAPARGIADFDLATVAESDGRQFSFTTTVDILPSIAKSPEPNSILIEAKHTGGFPLRFDLPPEAKLRETNPGADGGTWVIDLMHGKHRVAIRIIRPVPATGGLPVPKVAVRTLGANPGRSRQWLAVSAAEIRSRGASGLRLQSMPLTDPPAETKTRDLLTRSQSVWRVERDDWSLTVRSAPSPAAGLQPTIFTTVSAAVDETGHWLMEARYLIFHETDVPWSLVPDDAVSTLSATVDGRPLPDSLANGRIPLLLPAPPGLHEIRIVWRSSAHWDADPLPFALPRPEIGGDPVALGPVIWSVAPPLGRRVKPEPSFPHFGSSSRSLHSAANLDALTRALTGRIAPTALRSAEYRIDELLKEAAAQLGDASGDSGPDGQTLAEWYKQLRDRHPPMPQHPSEHVAFAEWFNRAGTQSWQTADAASPPIHFEVDDSIPVERWVVSLPCVGLLLAGLFWGRRISSQ